METPLQRGAGPAPASDTGSQLILSSVYLGLLPCKLLYEY